VRHIVVESKDAAEEILAQLRQGADFAVLAGKASVDAGTKEKGGDLGWLPRGLLPSELENVAFALQAGEISAAVAVGGRYEILEVVERDKARAVTPEVRSQLQSAMFDRWLEARRAGAKIERFVGE